MDIPSKFLTRLAPNVQGIVDAIDDVLELRESFLEKEGHLLAKLKCIYRVLHSVRSHYEPNDSCSYLDFIGPFMG